MIIYLIRHGKTYCNEEKLYCGKSDISLSEVGKLELEKRKNKINYPRCNLNFTSEAKRANETFELLYPNANYITKKEFWEYDFGDFELKSYEMLKEDKEYLDWICDETTKVTCPNGESREQFRLRLKNGLVSFLDELEEKCEKEALILCHGGTIATILQLFHKENLDFYSYHPECGGGYKLEVDKQDEKIKIHILERF